MAIYIEIDKESETEDLIIYRYCSNKTDWGTFSVRKQNVMDMEIIHLAENDPDKKFVFRAWSGVNRSYQEEGQFPSQTCYAA